MWIQPLTQTTTFYCSTVLLVSTVLYCSSTVLYCSCTVLLVLLFFGSLLHLVGSEEEPVLTVERVV